MNIIQSTTEGIAQLAERIHQFANLLEQITITDEGEPVTLGILPDSARVAVHSRWGYDESVEDVYIVEKSVNGGAVRRDACPSGGGIPSPLEQACDRHEVGDTWASKFRFDDDEPIQNHVTTLIGKFTIVARHDRVVVLREVPQVAGGLRAV